MRFSNFNDRWDRLKSDGADMREEMVRKHFLIRITAVFLGVAFFHAMAWPTTDGIGVRGFCERLALVGSELVLVILGVTACRKIRELELRGEPIVNILPAFLADFIRSFDDWRPKH